MSSVCTRPSRGWARLAAVGATIGLLLGGMSGVSAAPPDTGSVCPAPSANADFPDVHDGQFEEVIECLGGYGIAGGFRDGEYKPLLDVTRGQMAEFISNLVDTGQPGILDATAPNDFADVADDGEFVDAIAALADAGVVEGTSTTTYEPAATVTRGQMAKFIALAIEVATGTSLVDGDQLHAFGDVAEDGQFADVINALAHEGIVQGTGDGYDPTGTVNRGQMALFIMRAAEYLENHGFWLAPFDLESEGRIQTVRTDVPSPFFTFRTAGPDDVFGNDDDEHHTIYYQQAFAFQYASGQSTTSIELADFERWASGPGEDGLGAVPGDRVSVTYAQDPADSEVVLLDDTPLAVDDLTGSAGDADTDGVDDDAVLAWQAPSTPDVVAYEVHRAVQDGQGNFPTPTHLATETDAVSYEDRNLDTGAYLYWVVAVNGESGQRGLLDSATVEIGDEPVSPPPSPSGVPTVDSLSVDGSSVADGGTTTSNSSTPVVTGSASDADGTVADVEYRVDGAAYTSASATDGTFDAAGEDFEVTLGSLSDGDHTVDVRAVDEQGDVSPVYSVTVTVQAAAPTIQSVETDPANDRLIVTFSEETTCPDTANARGAWKYSDTSKAGDDTGHPASVSDSEGGVCYLHFDHIEADDYGRLSYTPSSTDADQVRDASGAFLPAHTAEDVIDAVAPTFDSVDVAGSGGGTDVKAVFSEELRNGTVDTADFVVTVAGSPRAIASVALTGDTVTLGLESPALNPGETVEVTFDAAAGAGIRDVSGDNLAPSATKSGVVT